MFLIKYFKLDNKLFTVTSVKAFYFFMLKMIIRILSLVPLGSCLDFPVSFLMHHALLAEIKPFLPSLPLAMLFLTVTGEANQDTDQRKQILYVVTILTFLIPACTSLLPTIANPLTIFWKIWGPITYQENQVYYNQGLVFMILWWTEASVVRPRTPVFLRVFTLTPYSLPFLPQLIFPLKLGESSSQGTSAEKLMTFWGQENIPSLRRPFGLR